MIALKLRKSQLFWSALDECTWWAPNLVEKNFLTGPTNQTLNDAQCAELGADFCGNRADYRIPADPQVFLMCYNGKYVDCMECQHELQFIELTNFKNEYDIYGQCAWPVSQLD